MRILQARILKWAAVPSSRDLSNPGIKPRSSALQADSLPSEPPGKLKNTRVGSLSLLQGILWTQDLKRSLLHCRWIHYQLSYPYCFSNHPILDNFLKTPSESFWYACGSLSEKAMAPHSSTLAWKIPRMEEPGRLQSMGSLRIGNDWATSLSLFTFMHWRRKWQPTLVFLPGESQGRGSLVGCRLWGHTESDTTEVT